MSLVPFAAVLSATLLMPALVDAQTGRLPRPCDATVMLDLAGCLAPGERIRVHTSAGDRISGAYRGIADGELLLETDELRVQSIRSFPERDVEAIARLHPNRKPSIAVGAASGGLLGLLTAATSTRDGATAGAIVAIFSGVGAALGALAPEETAQTVYIHRRTAATATSPETAAPATRLGAPPPVPATVVALAERVHPGERLRVQLRDDVIVLGDFTRVVDDTLVVSIRGRDLSIAEHDIVVVEHKVSRAKRWSMTKGAIIGGSVCAGLTMIGWAASSDEERAGEPLAPDLAIATVTCAAGGALLARVFGGSQVELVMFRRAAQARAPRAPAPTLTWTWAF